MLRAEDFERVKADYPEFSEALNRASSERTEQLSSLLLEGVVL